MKHITLKALLFLTGLTLLEGKTVAQAVDSETRGSGIYLTEADFAKNNVTLFSENDPVNHLECNLEEVTLIRGGKTYKLGRGSFFGYYQDGMQFRYYQDNTKLLSSYGYYRILEDSRVVVYSKTAASPKTGSHVWYYYSDTVNSPIKRISAKTLKNVPPDIYPVLAKYLLAKSGKSLAWEN